MVLEFFSGAKILGWHSCILLLILNHITLSFRYYLFSGST